VAATSRQTNLPKHIKMR